MAMILAPAGVTACGSAGTAAPAGSDGAAPSSPPRSVAAATACANLTLKPSLTVSGAAAGTAYYTLRFTNISAHSCTLYGYPGVSFVSGVPGHQIGSAATHNPLYSPATVVLAVHATAHAVLGVAAAGNYPPSRCQPTTAHALRIFPPGQTAAVSIHRDFAACAGGVQVLSVTAVRPGRGGNGS